MRPPPPPKSKPFTPCFSLLPSFPLPERSSQPHLRAASGCKNAQLGGGGVGGGGRGPGGGAFGRGLMELWGLPRFPPPQCTGLELAPLFPGLRCRDGGARGERGRGPAKEGGREGAGKERGGGERATRQSCECACADLARCPGEGESAQRQDLGLVSGPRVEVSGPPLASLGPGASSPQTGPSPLPRASES